MKNKPQPKTETPANESNEETLLELKQKEQALFKKNSVLLDAAIEEAEDKFGIQRVPVLITKVDGHYFQWEHRALTK